MRRGERELRAALGRADVPGEARARERAWQVVDAAFADRAPVPRRTPWRPVAAIAAAGRDLSDDAIALLAQLSPEHRAVVVLRYVLEYTPGEIAALLDLPRGTVNSRLRRGLDALARELEAER